MKQGLAEAGLARLGAGRCGARLGSRASPQPPAPKPTVLGIPPKKTPHACTLTPRTPTPSPAASSHPQGPSAPGLVLHASSVVLPSSLSALWWGRGPLIKEMRPRSVLHLPIFWSLTVWCPVRSLCAGEAPAEVLPRTCPLRLLRLLCLFKQAVMLKICLTPGFIMKKSHCAVINTVWGFCLCFALFLQDDLFININIYPEEVIPWSLQNPKLFELEGPGGVILQC